MSSHHLFFLDFSSASKCHIKICKSTRKYCNIRVSLENESIGYWYWYWYFQYFQNAKIVLKYWVFSYFSSSIGIEYWILLDEYWFIPCVIYYMYVVNMLSYVVRGFFVDILLYLYQIHSVQKDVDYSHFFNFHDDDNFIWYVIILIGSAKWDTFFCYSFFYEFSN